MTSSAMSKVRMRHSYIVVIMAIITDQSLRQPPPEPQHSHTLNHAATTQENDYLPQNVFKNKGKYIKVTRSIGPSDGSNLNIVYIKKKVSTY